MHYGIWEYCQSTSKVQTSSTRESQSEVFNGHLAELGSVHRDVFWISLSCSWVAAGTDSTQHSPWGLKESVGLHWEVVTVAYRRIYMSVCLSINLSPVLYLVSSTNLSINMLITLVCVWMQVAQAAHGLWPASSRPCLR